MSQQNSVSWLGNASIILPITLLFDYTLCCLFHNKNDFHLQEKLAWLVYNKTAFYESVHIFSLLFPTVNVDSSLICFG